MGLVAGVVACNGLLVGVGYCLLHPSLMGHSLRVHASYAGVALLVGAAAVGVVLCALAPLGIHVGLVAFAAVALCLGALGITTGRLLPARLRARIDADPRSADPPATVLGDLVATVAAFALVAILAFAVVGGFRGSPWLDDSWYFWLPKGRALDLVGLDPRLWRPNPALHMVFGRDYESLWFIRPDNPLWWSVLANLDVRFVGTIDMRALNGELAFLLVGFVAAAARLLWGRVRASVLLPGLLVLLAAPELLRQAQGGDADVPLAVYVALAILAAAGWLALRSGFALVLFFAFASAAVAIKSEGVLELGLDLAIVSVAAWRCGRRLVWLWVVAGAALATSGPWFLWRAAHGVSNVFSLQNALSPSYLSEHTNLLHGGLRILGEHFTSVREWSLIVPLALVLGTAGLIRERRIAWLVPAAFLAFGYLVFVWISWADPDGAFRLVASAYRYVTPPIVLAGIFVPLLAERLIRSTRRLS
jgi:hypothetical protein